MKKHVLVVASTFPAHSRDSVPAFVRDQIVAMKAVDPELIFSVLAPHDQRSETKSFAHHDAYDEYRFHYFWPTRVEQLAGRGIMPALKANPLNYLVIPFLFVGEIIALFRLTHRLKPDVVYAHWFTPQAVTTELVSRLLRVPFVFTTHASDVAVWHKIPLFGGMIVRYVTGRTNRFTAVSRRSMAKLQRFFTDSEWQQFESKRSIIPMGTLLPEPNTTTADPHTILFIGRLAEKKGVHYLLPAFAELHRSRRSARLIIVGDGPMRKQLEKQSRELGIEKSVDFIGYTTGDAKQSAIEKAGIYVVPSIITASGDAEGLPVSLMEGLAHGKVCIATPESGADDIITDGYDGFLVPQKNSPALAAALDHAFSLSTYDVQTIADAARETAEQFAWSHIAKRHIDFLFGGPDA